MRGGYPITYRVEGIWPPLFIVKGADKMTERDPLLEERQKTHGSFELNAKISQDIKAIIREYTIYKTLEAKPNRTQSEALDMIALKLSRILSGQASFKDHWDDIAGYAKLGAEACQK